MPAAAQDAVDGRDFLVGTEIAGDRDVLEFGPLFEDPGHDVVGSQSHHVVSGSIAGRQLEAQIDKVRGMLHMVISQASEAAGAFDDLGEFVTACR